MEFEELERGEGFGGFLGFEVEAVFAVSGEEFLGVVGVVKARIGGSCVVVLYISAFSRN
jgi:hypothetical protein